MKFSGIVMAGGHSSRMGQDKTLMSVNKETLIEKTVKELCKVVDEIIIASNQRDKYKIPGTVEILDSFPGMGPLGGIHAGLRAASYQYSFVVASDMPFFTANLAHYLLSRCDGYDVVAPKIEGSWEPLCAVYSKSCLKPIEQYILTDIRSVYGFYPGVRVLNVSKEELLSLGYSGEIFLNLNTPDEYKDLINRESNRVGNFRNKVH